MASDGSGKLAKLLVRAGSGAVFAVAIIAAFVGGFWTAAGLFLVVVAISTNELYTLIEAAGGSKPLGIAGLFVSIGLFAVAALVSAGVVEVHVLSWFALAVALVFALQLGRRKNKAFVDASVTLTGALYVGGGFAFLPFLMCFSGSYDYALPLGVVFLIWASDTFAYLTGSFLGRTRMLKAVSPNKTWEGFLGGLVFAVGTGWVLSQFWTVLEPGQWMVAGALTAVFGTLGDFIESLLKRQSGMKDSGNIMPGHGGLLDRFDGFLFALPVVYLYVSQVAG